MLRERCEAMVDPHLIRAFYDEKSDAYVSEAVFWAEEEPSLVYKFSLLENAEQPDRFDGGLLKEWQDDSSDVEGEFVTFATYASEAEFKADVNAIRAEAEQHADDENLDGFLAVIDIVKKRAMDNGFLDEEEWLDLEGLFEMGPQDAYTLRDMLDVRLHDHVECDPECWQLRVSKVSDEQGSILGWGVLAFHFLDLPEDASRDAINRADHARVLLMEHHHTIRNAKLGVSGIVRFMEGTRLDDPDLAYMNDTEILESIAYGADDPSVSLWSEKSGEELHSLMNEKTLFVCNRADWQPRTQTPLDRFLAEHPQPVWFEDQFRAAMDAMAGIGPEDDE